jgi:mannose-6-phosphate isomerase
VAFLIRRIGILLCCGALLCACERTTAPDRAIDAAWHRKALLDGVLSHWLAVAPAPSGLFRVKVSRDWRPQLDDPPRLELTMQGRLVYSMITGYEISKDRRYLDAATRGADFLLAHFHDPLQGGFYNVVDEGGRVIADRKRAYGQAAALLALAQMARITGEKRYKDAALMAWQEIAQGLLDAQGGLVEVTTRDFKPESPERTQNPVMHMFEALLALVEATDDPQARIAARAMGDFVINKLMQGRPDGSASIPEWYDSEWKPLPTREKGAYTDLGHQFEWVHLLQTGSRLGISPVYDAVADRLLQYALQNGYDEIDGGAFNRIYPDGSVERDKGYWEQAECLHALLSAASLSERRELWRRYDQTLALIQQQLIDNKNGGWHAAVCPRGDCMDDQPEPYHMASLHRAALQAAGR